ncbi:hypothetical protein, partial [Salmonella sp. s51228]|uniref:hypothetical protein n=1 Tax=Salmonella sp. s51228 TaxID=3159652 RepID=UPI0039814CC6
MKEERERLWNERKAVQPDFQSPSEAEFVYDIEGNLVYGNQVDDVTVDTKRKTPLDDAPWKDIDDIEGGKSRKPWQQKWTKKPENPLYDSKEYLADFQNPLTDDDQKEDVSKKKQIKGSRARK